MPVQYYMLQTLFLGVVKVTPVVLSFSRMSPGQHNQSYPESTCFFIYFLIDRRRNKPEKYLWNMKNIHVVWGPTICLVCIALKCCIMLNLTTETISIKNVQPTWVRIDQRTEPCWLASLCPLSASQCSLLFPRPSSWTPWGMFSVICRTPVSCGHSSKESQQDECICVSPLMWRI